MIELAVSTGAAITPVEEESAAALAEQGGVAALLRY
jgi:stalled ribosome rescue protein Dom34